MKGLCACGVLALALAGCGESDKSGKESRPNPSVHGRVTTTNAPVSPADKLQAEVNEMMSKEASLIKQKLAVLEQPGVWKHVNVSFQAQSKTKRESTDEAHTYWALGGKCLVTEIHELEPDADTYQLILRTYDVRNEKYRMFFYMRPGHAQVFSGKWDGRKKAVNWTLDFESPGRTAANVDVVIVETIMSPSRKKMDFKVTNQGNLLASGGSECTLVKDGKVPAPPKKPADKLEVLGDAGRWEEEQTLEEEASQPQTLKTLSQSRWLAGGNFLLIEGQAEVSGHTEHTLAVKCYSAETQLYCYAYIWDPGYVDHYRGKWDPGAQKVAWKSEFLTSFPVGVAVNIHETLPRPDRKNWVFEVIKDGKVILTGHGNGRRMGD